MLVRARNLAARRAGALPGCEVAIRAVDNLDALWSATGKPLLFSCFVEVPIE
jgi:hypothetical protein